MYQYGQDVYCSDVGGVFVVAWNKESLDLGFELNYTLLGYGMSHLILCLIEA